MRTKKNNFFTAYNKATEIIAPIVLLAMLMALLACSKDETNPDPQPTQTGEIKGSIKDENGNPYPNTTVTFSKDSEKQDRSTNEVGAFQGSTNALGAYKVEMKLPLSTEAVSTNPATVDVKAGAASSVNFVIKPLPVKAHLNFGTVQLLEEIVDKDGNTPINSDEPLFAKNIFDVPFGQLNEIRAPDGHQITLAEFQTANGNLLVRCNGNSSIIKISLEGMIPNGTYTFWLAFLKRKVKVGESIDFGNDFVNQTNPAIGPSDGSGNVVVADINGNINTTLQHSSCILSDEAALVIPVLYHLNGKTFGGGHQPDAEEMVQMLVYFQ